MSYHQTLTATTYIVNYWSTEIFGHMVSANATTYVHASRGVSISLFTAPLGQHAHIKINPEQQF